MTVHTQGGTSAANPGDDDHDMMRMDSEGPLPLPNLADDAAADGGERHPNIERLEMQGRTSG